MNRSQSSRKMLRLFRASDRDSKAFFMKAGSLLFLATLLLVLMIWRADFETFESYAGPESEPNKDWATRVDGEKVKPSFTKANPSQLPNKLNNIALEGEIDGGNTKSKGQHLNASLEEVPASLRAWAPLQEKSLRTPEEQEIFELQTIQKLDEALQFLKEQKPLPDQNNSDEFFRNESKRIWNVTLVSEALRNRNLERSQLQLIDNFLIECSSANRPDPADFGKNNQERMERKAELLLDCVSVAHVYARTKPEDWSALEKRAPSGFETIAKVANQYMQIQ